MIRIFVHLRQKVRLRPKLSPKFLSTLGPSPAKPEPDPKSPARLTTLCRLSLLKQKSSAAAATCMQNSGRFSCRSRYFKK